MSKKTVTVLRIFLVLLALFFVWRLTLMWMIHSKLEEVRKEGLPANCAELNQWYQEPPAGENAADIYMKAFEKYSKEAEPTVESKIPWPSESEPLNDRYRQAIPIYLSKNAEAMSLLHQASSKNQCRYPVVLKKGLYALTPYIGNIRQAVRNFRYEAAIQIEQNQPDLVSESILDSVAVCRSLKDEPLLLSQLIRFSCEYVTTYNLCRALNHIQFTDQQLAQLSKAFSDIDVRHLTVAFIGERCLFTDEFLHGNPKHLAGSEPRGSMPRSFFIFYKLTGLLDLDTLYFLDALERDIKISQLPRAVDRFTDSKQASQDFANLPLTAFFTKKFAPPIHDCMIRELRDLAMIRSALSAIAVERYRLANNKLPTQLSDLVPEFIASVPEDPFDGNPLRYRKLAKGYLIYSVGADCKDDDGKNDTEQHAAEPDIPFRVDR